MHWTGHWPRWRLICNSAKWWSSACIIRWCSMYNHGLINIRRSICCCRMVSECQANSLRQTGSRFMNTLADSYGVTRRGMTQCISASLLVLDRWSRPNMTVPRLILSKHSVNFIYLLYWQWWLIGNVKSVSVPSVTPQQQRFTATFGWGSIKRRGFMIYTDLQESHLRLICFTEITINKSIAWFTCRDHAVKWGLTCGFNVSRSLITGYDALSVWVSFSYSCLNSCQLNI